MAKAKAYPKSMGACADLLFDMKAKRLDLDKAAAAAKAEETALINHIIDKLDKESSGAAGKHHRVQVITKQKPQVKDWAAFYAYVKKNDAFDLLQRRIGEQAVMDRLEDPKNRKGLPGVEMFQAVTVSLTKV
jgi:GTP-binding protein EngB required for normal cell division